MYFLLYYGCVSVTSMLQFQRHCLIRNHVKYKYIINIKYTDILQLACCVLLGIELNDELVLSITDND